MQKLLIKGKKELKGDIYISGSKNATLPILASTILASEVRLLNVPFVKDIFTMLELLKFIGIKVKMKRNKNILSTLGHLRQQKSQIYFGQNMIHANKGSIVVGDSVEILE